MEINTKIEFSLGYNFDSELVEKIAELNGMYGNGRKVNEFFGALPFSPFLSTRPDNRIKNITWNDFLSQLRLMQKNGINFNYLFNAKSNLNEIDLFAFTDFIKKLHDSGITNLIVYSPEICSFIKNLNSKFSVTISSVYNICSEKQIDKAYNSGADFLYFDSIYINRNFGLLSTLSNYSKVPIKLYANVSCLSKCVNKDLHYSVLSSSDKEYQIAMNDKLFSYCSSEKLRNPVNWLQMQWIRPEDIDIYVEEGFSHFKLTDRLAPTENLVFIANHYLKGASPRDLFPLIERNGTKFRNFANHKLVNQNPLSIDNSLIPKNFIEHFRSGECDSTNVNCDFCNKVTKNAIEVNIEYMAQKEIKSELY